MAVPAAPMASTLLLFVIATLSEVHHPVHFHVMQKKEQIRLPLFFSLSSFSEPHQFD